MTTPVVAEVFIKKGKMSESHQTQPSILRPNTNQLFPQQETTVGDKTTLVLFFFVLSFFFVHSLTMMERILFTTLCLETCKVLLLFSSTYSQDTTSTTMEQQLGGDCKRLMSSIPVYIVANPVLTQVHHHPIYLLFRRTNEWEAKELVNKFKKKLVYYYGFDQEFLLDELFHKMYRLFFQGRMDKRSFFALSFYILQESCKALSQNMMQKLCDYKSPSLVHARIVAGHSNKSQGGDVENGSTFPTTSSCCTSPSPSSSKTNNTTEDSPHQMLIVEEELYPNKRTPSSFSSSSSSLSYRTRWSTDSDTVSFNKHEGLAEITQRSSPEESSSMVIEEILTSPCSSSSSSWRMTRQADDNLVKPCKKVLADQHFPRSETKNRCTPPAKWSISSKEIIDLTSPCSSSSCMTRQSDDDAECKQYAGLYKRQPVAVDFGIDLGGIYTGIVTNVERATDHKNMILFAIDYDDGDRGDLEWEEFLEAMELYQNVVSTATMFHRVIHGDGGDGEDLKEHQLKHAIQLYQTHFVAAVTSAASLFHDSDGQGKDLFCILRSCLKEAQWNAIIQFYILEFAAKTRMKK
eukprot:scaffold1123_cov56-Cylindrotheca_fusiformis.AAC.3